VLSNEAYKIAKLEYGQCAWRQGKALSSILDSVFEQMPIVSDSSVNTAEEACEDRLAAM